MHYDEMGIQRSMLKYVNVWSFLGCLFRVTHLFFF
jgi:hypothetical protein